MRTRAGPKENARRPCTSFSSSTTTVTDEVVRAAMERLVKTPGRSTAKTETLLSTAQADFDRENGNKHPGHSRTRTYMRTRAGPAGMDTRHLQELIGRHVQQGCRRGYPRATTTPAVNSSTKHNQDSDEVFLEEGSRALHNLTKMVG